MSIASEVERISSHLTGTKSSRSDLSTLTERLPGNLAPAWLISILHQHALAGTCFSLNEEEDKSGLGVELKWLTPAQIVDEALYAYPGKKVLKLGYLPIASCLLGSGDPYFLKITSDTLEDPPLVRVPHELIVDENNNHENEIEVVCNHLSHFLAKSKIE